MSPLDLIRSSADGSMSLTKLAATTFHFLLACTVAGITCIDRKFHIDMWLLYAGFAVGHATYDKTLATFASYKEKKLEGEQPQQPL